MIPLGSFSQPFQSFGSPIGGVPTGIQTLSPGIVSLPGGFPTGGITGPIPGVPSMPSFPIMPSFPGGIAGAGGASPFSPVPGITGGFPSPATPGSAFAPPQLGGGGGEFLQQLLPAILQLLQAMTDWIGGASGQPAAAQDAAAGAAGAAGAAAPAGAGAPAAAAPAGAGAAGAAAPAAAAAAAPVGGAGGAGGY